MSPSCLGFKLRPVLSGLVITSPHRAALPLFISPGVLGRGWGCEPASDALCRARPATEQAPQLKPSTKTHLLRRRVNDDDLDEPGRLPSEGAPSPPAFARRRRCTNRRQQSNAIRGHDLESTKPRAPRPEVALVARCVGRLAPCGATLPGFIGLGASSAFGRRGAASAISRVGRGDPNPLCPDTSLRELVVLPDGDSGIPGDCAVWPRLAFAQRRPVSSAHLLRAHRGRSD